MAFKNKNLTAWLKRRPKQTAAAAVATAGVVVGIVAFSGHNNQSALPAPPTPTIQTTPAPLKNTSDATPKQQANHAPASQPTVNGKTKVTIYITSAEAEGNSITVRSYADNILESGGVCTATFSRDGYDSLSATSRGIANVSYTTCPPIRIARNKFLTAGNWRLKVSYSSDTATGSVSQTIRIE